MENRTRNIADRCRKPDLGGSKQVKPKQVKPLENAQPLPPLLTFPGETFPGETFPGKTFPGELSD
jgi:hypothetical protein